MIMKIDHIGVAVKDMDKALALFRDALGLELEGSEEVATQKVRVAFLPVGETNVELLTPTQDDSNVAKHLEKKGEGFHHIAFAVDDIEGALKGLKEKGVQLINEEPVPGAHGKRIAFIHPKATHGIMVELCQK